MKKFMSLVGVGFLVVGCGLNDETQNPNQHYIQAKVAVCKDFSNCDTLETSINYTLSLDNGQDLKVSKKVYDDCESGTYYPDCIGN